MGKWANGKLKVEHVAAPHGGRQGWEAGQQHWASCPFLGGGRLRLERGQGEAEGEALAC